MESEDAATVANGPKEENNGLEAIPKERYLRNLAEEEVALIDFLSKRGYGTVWIAGFMGILNTCGLSPLKVLEEVQRKGFVDAPTQGMIRKYMEEGTSKVAVFRRATPAKMKEYIDINSMSFDLYDTFHVLKGMIDDLVQDGSVDAQAATKLGRVMKDIYEALQEAAHEDVIKTSGKTQFNIVNIVDNIGRLISPECKEEVDAVIEKHIRMKHEKGEAIDVDGKVE